MVNDSEVKAQKSPFAMRINERKVFDGKDGYVSINQVMFNVDMGYITDIHFEILEVINQYEFVTARQIFQVLQMKGIDIKWDREPNVISSPSSVPSTRTTINSKTSAYSIWKRMKF